MATSPPGLNHIRAQDSLDQLRARLGQEQFDQAQAEAMALSSDEARHYACADGRVPCHQGPRGVSGAFVDVSGARNSPRRSPCYHLTTLAAGIESM